MRLLQVLAACISLLLWPTSSARLVNFNKCTDGVGEMMIYNAKTKRFICYQLYSEKQSNGTSYEESVDHCLSADGYQPVTFETAEEFDFLKTNYFDRLTQNISNLQYFTIGAATFYGTLTFVNDANITFLMNKLRSSGINPTEDGCYQYAKSKSTPGEFIKVQCDKLHESYLICQRSWNKASTSDFPFVGQKPEGGGTEGTETAESPQSDDLEPTAQKTGTVNKDNKANEEKLPVPLLAVCFMLGFTSGAIITICVLKCGYFKNACCGGDDGGKAAEEGEAKPKADSGKKEAEKPAEKKVEEAVKEEEASSAPPPPSESTAPAAPAPPPAPGGGGGPPPPAPPPAPSSGSGPPAPAPPPAPPASGAGAPPAPPPPP